MSYEVRTPVYDGPFELLLHLILKEEVELWDVSIAPVIDAFLVEVERLDRVDLEVATEFLLIASTLVELKARRLLPGADATELDEELLRFEERDLLLARLLECKTFKDAARVLESALRIGSRAVPRSAGPEEPFRTLAPDPLERVTPAQLLAAATRGLAPRPPEIIDTFHVAPIRASVRDAVEALLVAMPHDRAVTFRSLVEGIDVRLEVIVRFLAVLELFKQGVIDLEQADTFGDLVVRRLGHGDRPLDATSLDDWDDAPAARAESAYSDPVVVGGDDGEDLTEGLDLDALEDGDDEPTTAGVPMVTI